MYINSKTLMINMPCGDREDPYELVKKTIVKQGFVGQIFSEKENKKDFFSKIRNSLFDEIMSILNSFSKELLDITLMTLFGMISLRTRQYMEEINC